MTKDSYDNGPNMGRRDFLIAGAAAALAGLEACALPQGASSNIRYSSPAVQITGANHTPIQTFHFGNAYDKKGNFLGTRWLTGQNLLDGSGGVEEIIVNGTIARMNKQSPSFHRAYKLGWDAYRPFFQELSKNGVRGITSLHPLVDANFEGVIVQPHIALKPHEVSVNQFVAGYGFQVGIQGVNFYNPHEIRTDLKKSRALDHEEKVPNFSRMKGTPEVDKVTLATSLHPEFVTLYVPGEAGIGMFTQFARQGLYSGQHMEQVGQALINIQKRADPQWNWNKFMETFGKKK